jgi:hypothetical protein
MASIIYNSCLEDEARGAIDFDTDSFKAMVVTSTYTENKDTHLKRSDITNELSGGNYPAGGIAVTCSITKDTANDRVDITLGGGTIGSNFTGTGRKLVYYKSRGGASSADELIACIDWGSDVVTVNGTLTITASTLRKQNGT